MVEKLNEATFKPLFGRMYDWAAIKSDTEPQGEKDPQASLDLRLTLPHV